uniref:Uncharacterized protein n=1 Tax=Erpetoichthys calabaricus TaxID=27687 RepID=A0A8C4RVH9_ERPCA
MYTWKRYFWHQQHVYHIYFLFAKCLPIQSRAGALQQSECPFRRVTFSVVSQPQDPHQGSLQSCYDSGLEESETPSSKSSSGPRLGALPLPEDNYERTTPDGSVGEAEHMENGRGKHN